MIVIHCGCQNGSDKRLLRFSPRQSSGTKMQNFALILVENFENYQYGELFLKNSFI